MAKSKKRVVRALFFDIDDTLYSTTAFAATARRNSVRAMRTLGLRMPEEHLVKELNEVIHEFTSNYEHHFDKLLLRIPRRAYEGINTAILVAAAIKAYHETKVTQLKPYSDVPPVLKKLMRTDVTRGVITAGLAVKQAEKLIRLNLYRYFTPTAIFISDQIGISKPNVKLYQRACEEMDIEPREVVYVGDNPQTDIDPPNSIGMITVLNLRSEKIYPESRSSRPHYKIKNFHDLLQILKRDFQMNLT